MAGGELHTVWLDTGWSNAVCKLFVMCALRGGSFEVEERASWKNGNGFPQLAPADFYYGESPGFGCNMYVLSYK